MQFYVDMLDETNNCRFATDGITEKLHFGAGIVKLSPAKFVCGENLDYYLINAAERRDAIRCGALPVTNAELVERCGKHNQKFKVLDEEIFQQFWRICDCNLA